MAEISKIVLILYCVGVFISQHEVPRKDFDHL